MPLTANHQPTVETVKAADINAIEQAIIDLAAQVTGLSSRVTALAAVSTVVPVGGPANVLWGAPVFADDFDGTALDTTRWHSGWFGDGVLSDPVNTTGYETAGYASSNISVSNSQVHFKVGPNTGNRARAGGTVYPNIGATITSDPRQGASVGYMSPGYNYYVESRMKMPAKVAGSTAQPQPAFWQDPSSWPAGFEVDVVEAYGADSGQWHVHYPSAAGATTQYSPAPGGTTPVPGATTGFHTYGALVEGPTAALPNGRISFYYDGAFAGQIVPTIPVPNTPRFFILGTSAGGTGALPGDVYCDVDYVRCWTYPGVSNPTAAFAPDATSGARLTTGGNNLTWTHTPTGAPNYVLVTVATNVQSNGTADLVEAPTITYGGQAMTERTPRVASTGTVGADRAVRVYHLFNPPAGAQPVVVAIPTLAGGSAPTYSAEAFSFVGAAAAQSGAVASAASATGVSVISATGSYASGSCVVGVAVARSTANLSAGAGQTVVNQLIGGTNVAALYTTQPGGTNQITSASWSTQADQAAVVAIPVLPA